MICVTNVYRYSIYAVFLQIDKGKQKNKGNSKQHNIMQTIVIGCSAISLDLKFSSNT